MSREIKFRVWDTHFSRWFLPCKEQTIPLLWVGAGGEIIFSNLAAVAKETAIIEQFTGLKDKNGKEIYEGDIIKRRNFFISGLESVKKEEYDIFAVEWAGAGFWNFAVNDTNKTSALFEVIGNIHENPELLK